MSNQDSEPIYATPEGGYTLSFDSLASNYNQTIIVPYQNQPSITDTSMNPSSSIGISFSRLDSVSKELNEIISEDLKIQDDNTEEEQPSNLKLTASTAKEREYAEAIQEYEKERDKLKDMLKKMKEKQRRQNIDQSDLEVRMQIVELEEQKRQGAKKKMDIEDEINNRDKILLGHRNRMKNGMKLLQKQDERIEMLKKKIISWNNIIKECTYKKSSMSSYYEASFKKISNDFGFKFSTKDGRLFLNESNIILINFEHNYLISSNVDIGLGDFIMAAGEVDVSSLNKDGFDNLLQSKLRDEEKIKLTLRRNTGKKYKQISKKLCDFQKDHHMKSEDLPLELVFCKDNSDTLPKSFPMENYDIIEKIDGVPTNERLEAIKNKLFRNGTTIEILRYFDTDEEPPQQQRMSENVSRSSSVRGSSNRGISDNPAEDAAFGHDYDPIQNQDYMALNYHFARPEYNYVP